jgi:hypothetical protein
VTLLTEGDLDAQVLRPLLAGVATVRSARSSKHALVPRVRAEREKLPGPPTVFCVRDRDFDFDVPEDGPIPLTDHTGVLGWYWCRHEIENYLLEPDLVATTYDLDRDDVVQRLTAAALRIREYQAARWAVGVSRRSLPPNYHYRTRPLQLASADLRLPGDLSWKASRTWALKEASSFAAIVRLALCRKEMSARLTAYRGRFDAAFCESAEAVLAWFSGKDLLTATGEWLTPLGPRAPGQLRRDLGERLASLPWQEIASLFPEWRTLRERLGESGERLS